MGPAGPTALTPRHRAIRLCQALAQLASQRSRGSLRGQKMALILQPSLHKATAVKSFHHWIGRDRFLTRTVMTEQATFTLSGLLKITLPL